MKSIFIFLLKVIVYNRIRTIFSLLESWTSLYETTKDWKDPQSLNKCYELLINSRKEFEVILIR